MKTAQIRQKFLDFYASKGHTIEPSASLIPHNDKTLLFVNAGMVPFKDVFSGVEKRPYNRAASCQRCVRAGGKHNDLENVGYTARHHTFFEMLGNFSFGDYFKREAIQYAWEFLTVELRLPKEKLWVSVFEEDDEAEDIWVNEIGFPRNRISRCGAKDNFWQMGDTGPCGPSSEIFYDHGENIAGGPPGHADEDGDRYIEIWNLVFTQYDKQEDGYLKPLAAPCVDTGMGLERLAAVLQHKNNNYDTDGFKTLTKAIVGLTKEDGGIKQDNASVRVIADHIRSTAFMVVDGVIPSNEGRGYVLRRIIRRAIRHGHKIGINKVFFYRLAPVLALELKDAYPELKKALANVEKVLKREEQRFAQTLDQGMGILTAAITQLKGNEIDGETVFKLYDTYGFPADLTADVAREHSLTIDMVGFEIEMTKQRDRARQAGDFKTLQKGVDISEQTQFLGYEQLESSSSVQALIKEGELVEQIEAGEHGIVVLATSSFYAESGGQIGDCGILSNDTVAFVVSNTQKQKSGAFEHHGILNKGILKVGDVLAAVVDKKSRKCIARNHSATHLLHAALRTVLGETVTQKGSLVDSEKLRFDFSHDEVINKVEIDKIEGMVNRKILANTKVHTDVSDIDTAKKKGAVALFGEKYGDTVRVLTMGKDDFSVELCGGTHVNQLGDIGLFRITSEGGVSAGVRRIEAVTGYSAYQFDNQTQDNLNQIAQMTKSSSVQVVEKVAQLIKQQKELEKQIVSMQKQLASNQGDDLVNQAQGVNGVSVLASVVEGVNGKDLRDIVDKLKDKLGSAVIVLAAVSGNKVSLVAGVTKDLTDKYQAGKILNHVAQQVGGKGGGRPDMAQGGGTESSKVDEALASVKGLI
ncbi:Alanyl-tRNA synthetase (EC 6.1.1.7) [uncultured Gammaproteobacteria bacterium]|jgi:alanyl-tRNA synthetase|uniref:Alanine--tRNA ligase n=2 Tax=sulfur-oxidizing symbionts TaxID=32036 RepID=A0A1H6LD90_9GAMM|nr:MULTISPECIES: alanine--tRNA ligase [sulfur-oxidizing symbionts]CAC5836847.1 Alanyl-tRNA synthetase (EC 6.1.1.7) [uncultured Gammaproteobacteria bacterium]CAB5508179.1 Alanyl-tRNA synthetase (EC [Bathymodiolus thermophilus thioautotrophic gill symbiont]CAC9503661.1 Alanyl-tRNA synthetase (EC 6.1.1.7) [uncultured Gammaproteobacteria bacterium]CAC9505584.1 Alanyl-tRNA synthetase (EC 6.1.1.7) [uncultured Gammaproteobacteria bacterium]CAC9526576.1 Alanyl-tRNA synthetase (EC 6.1.1.7) [uncultured 